MDNLMEKEIAKKYLEQEGMVNPVTFVILVVLTSIMVYAVGIPVVQNIIDGSNLTTTDKTIANAVVTILGVIPIMTVAGGLYTL